MRLIDFFRSKLELASGFQDLPPGVQLYIISMMSDYCGRQLDEGPFCLKVVGSVDYMKLKDAGDSSLLLSGFFRDHVEAGPMSVDYYVSMGSMAYSKMSFVSMGSRYLFDSLSKQANRVSDMLWAVRKGLSCVERELVIISVG